ncbi:MAG TPA: NAD-dependent dihydropyrimidine dehydrogenase subunit PreA [Candidatus Limiplasma sp.]|nr:NAD-dependent dihydropyrimidine dehydrogenase subunit PreA [Candidatus Limiplasma sp.]
MSDTMFNETMMLREEAGACFLCSPASCTAACPYGLKPARVIRAVRFENTQGAPLHLPDTLACETCADKPCLSACSKGKVSRGIAIDAVLKSVHTHTPRQPESDLNITFCGVKCDNPFFLSSSIVANNYGMIARAFDMGWAGACMKTIGLFTPDEVSPRFDAIGKEATPFVGFKNIEQTSEKTAEENFTCIKQLKRDYPTKVIIASIMGRDEAEWTQLAKMAEEANADIIECNFSCPHMAKNGLGSDVGQNPEMVADYMRAVRRGTSLPVLAKMTPNLGNMEPPAIAAMEAGATGIAAINTVKSLMNVNLRTFSSGPDVRGQSSVGGYSGKAVKPIALRFIESMKKHSQLADVPISGMGGIETWRDAAEFIALGCETVQVTTAVMQYGYRIIEDMIEGMRLYLDEEGITISELVGRALPHIIPGDDLDRATICYPKFDRKKCVGCGRCYISCMDGGHQAITLSADNRPVLDGKACVGCHLCITVCPAEAISAGTCIPKSKNN